VLAFGDSITNGGGELQWGVALHSWAQWMARGLGLPFTNYALDGATAADVIAQQIPAFKRYAADPGGCYHVGCLYIGANDVRAVDFSAQDFGRELREVLEFLSSRCERTLTMTVPLDLGRPRAGAKVPAANAAISEVASEFGTLVVDLSDFRARNHVMADRVHPTAFGQIAIAERALARLAADGVPTRVAPHVLISYETDWWRRLHGDTAYVYRYCKELARAAMARVRP
jgi:lysophospholipase L1-like esterase